MKTLEEITYEVGRDALADQDAVVAGIRQRTGMLLAAQALVSSFLGAAALRVDGIHTWEWLAISALVAGLMVAVVLLTPWNLTFAVDARELYRQLYPQASQGATSDARGWLAAAGYGYQELRESNAARVLWMGRFSLLLGVLLVTQTLLWLTALAVD